MKFIDNDQLHQEGWLNPNILIWDLRRSSTSTVHRSYDRDAMEQQSYRRISKDDFVSTSSGEVV